MNFAKILLLSLFSFGIIVPNGVAYVALALHSGISHLSEIVEHAHEHEDTEYNFSLAEFIVEHSVAAGHEHQDQHSHDGMPIHHFVVMHEIPVFYQQVIYPTVPAMLVTRQLKTAIPVYNITTTADFSGKIWQPPKQA